MKLIILLARILATSSQASYFYISSDTVIVDVRNISPSPLQGWTDSLSPNTYLRPMSCLGEYGPLGAYGPLSGLGPLGFSGLIPVPDWLRDIQKDYWRNFDSMLRNMGTVESVTKVIRDSNHGPLSSDGPLGDRGPLNADYWDKIPYLGLNSGFLLQLQPAGLWTVLGAAGPLGPLGPLGVLGPLSGNFKANKNGQYLAGGGAVACSQDNQQSGICRSVTIKMENGEKRNFPLHENYTEEFARKAKDNDTSFTVTGNLKGLSDIHQYKFTSIEEQFVTIHITPLTASHLFTEAMAILGESSLQMGDAQYEFPKYYSSGNPLFPFAEYKQEELFDELQVQVSVTSKLGTKKIILDSPSLTKWIQLRVPAGSVFTTQIKLKSMWEVSPWGKSALRPVRKDCLSSWCPALYRITVVGSTSYIHSAVTGPHQKTLF